MNMAKWMMTAVAAVAAMGGWSGAAQAVRAPGTRVTGAITSTPGAGQIEIEHHVYRVVAGSPADHTLRNFQSGQIVDAELAPTQGGKPARVVAIALHRAS